MRKTLYIFYVPLLITEWLVDMITKIWQVIHTSVKEITLFIEKLIHEPDSGKDK